MTYIIMTSKQNLKLTIGIHRTVAFPKNARSVAISRAISQPRVRIIVIHFFYLYLYKITNNNKIVMISLTVLERSSFNINLWFFYIRTFDKAKQVRSRSGHLCIKHLQYSIVVQIFCSTCRKSVFSDKILIYVPL